MDDIALSPHMQGSLAATYAMRTREGVVPGDETRECPFLSSFSTSTPCHKKGGVCSIREYAIDGPIDISESQPAAVCPNRFLEINDTESIFSFLARTFFGVTSGAKVLKEIPFLHKVDADGQIRGAKAGRIDWVYTVVRMVGETPNLRRGRSLFVRH